MTHKVAIVSGKSVPLNYAKDQLKDLLELNKVATKRENK